jgi:CheY-like chemotaxis protein
MSIMISAPLAVLVVEDEPLIRLSLVADLEDAGFGVYEAAGADEALRLLSAHPEIEALFTDIDMPGSIDGLKLARLARLSHPKISILITSGYLKIAKNELPPETVYFSKPYDVGHVVNHIREHVSV